MGEKLTSKEPGEIEELLLLHKSLWKARGRRSKIAGTVYLIISAFFLILSFFTRYIVFEVISILSLLLGVMLVLVGLEKYVKLSVAEEALASAMLPINSLIEHLELKGKAAYIPHSSEVFVFIPKKENNKAVLKKVKELAISEKGLVTLSPATFLAELYERELGGNVKKFDLDYLFKWLPKMLVDDLKIAEKIEITRDEDRVRFELYEPLFSHLCEEERISAACKTVGCPICGSLANLLAKNTERIVFYHGCVYDSNKKRLTTSFTLGPSIKSSRPLESEERA